MLRDAGAASTVITKLQEILSIISSKDVYLTLSTRGMKTKTIVESTLSSPTRFLTWTLSRGLWTNRYPTCAIGHLLIIDAQHRSGMSCPSRIAI